jgi:hypothetical protein
VTRSITPLDGMLVHLRQPPQLLLIPIYSPGWREVTRSITSLDGMLVHLRQPPQLLLIPIYTPRSRRKKVGLSVLLKDTERSEPGTLRSGIVPLHHRTQPTSKACKTQEICLELQGL